MEGEFDNNVNHATADAGLPNVVNNINSEGQQPNEQPQQHASRTNVVREQIQHMPVANVTRIMRQILPPYAKISDGAKQTIQDCVTEYISFVTNEANERCRMERRRTVTAEDIIWAMNKLGFYNYVEPLTLYLNRYREYESHRVTGNPQEPIGRRSVLNLQPIRIADNSLLPPLLPTPDNMTDFFPRTGSTELGFDFGAIGSSSVELPLFPTDASSSQTATFDPFAGPSSSQGDWARFDPFPPFK